MRKYYSVFILLLCIATSANFAFSQEAVIRKHIEYLASDSLKGRLAGSPEELLTATYVRNALVSYDYKPLYTEGLQQFSYTFVVKRDGKIVRDSIYSHNVAVYLEGSDPTLKKEYIIIGAHHDHVGLGGAGSRRPDVSAIHYGADDNASGVAMALELAKSIASQKPNRSVIIATFGAEEQGIIGSKYMADHLPEQIGKPVIMLNFDMLGRLNEKKSLEINGTGTFMGAEILLRSLPNPDSLSLTMIPGGYGPSDHTSFYGAGIPVLFFTTGVHLDYHTPDDIASSINYEGMISIYDYVKNLTNHLLNAKIAPIYQKAGSETTPNTHSFNVSLGIIPDFNKVYEGEGMRADYVTDGRPAQKAGMKNGDIIMQVGDTKIINIEDYMKCLSELNAGDTVKVKVKRGETILDLTIHL